MKAIERMFVVALVMLVLSAGMVMAGDVQGKVVGVNLESQSIKIMTSDAEPRIEEVAISSETALEGVASLDQLHPGSVVSVTTEMDVTGTEEVVTSVKVL